MSQKIKIMQNGEEREIEVAHVFETQEQFQNALKSENSKGKNEILQALNVASVDEAKAKMGAQTQVEELAKQMAALKKQNTETERKLFAQELGIKPELVNKVIILAEASAGEGKDFKEIMKAEAEAIGALKGNDTKPAGPTSMGVQKTKQQIEEDAAWEAERQRLANLDPQAR